MGGVELTMPFQTFPGGGGYRILSGLNKSKGHRPTGGGVVGEAMRYRLVGGEGFLGGKGLLENDHRL